MNTISIKTSYNQIKKLSTTGKAYPADGAVYLIKKFKYLFIGYTLDAILNTHISDYHFSIKNKKQLHQSIRDNIEWAGPFVFIINNQKLFIKFSAPEHYEIGINSQNISDIIDISSQNIDELKKYGYNGQFIDITFLYNNEIIGQTVKDIHTIIDNRYEVSHLTAIIIELQNNYCLSISEEVDNPMLRVYQDITKAISSINIQKEKNFEFYKKK